MTVRLRNALVAAGGGGVFLLVLTWVLAFHVAAVATADQAAYREFVELGGQLGVAMTARSIANLCNLNPYVYLTGIPILVSVARRRLRLVLAVGMILLGANVTTELLKRLLAHPRAASLFEGFAPLGPASWPSGHATAAMALGLALAIAVPGNVRPIVAATGAVFAVEVSYSFLSIGSHYPSDVVGGFLVAAIWTVLAIAAFGSSSSAGRRSQPDRRLSIRAGVLTPALALAELIIALLQTHPHQVLSYARGHTAFVVGAVALAALAMALATAVVMALRR